MQYDDLEKQFLDRIGIPLPPNLGALIEKKSLQGSVITYQDIADLIFQVIEENTYSWYMPHKPGRETPIYYTRTPGRFQASDYLISRNENTTEDVYDAIFFKGSTEQRLLGTDKNIESLMERVARQYIGTVGKVDNGQVAVMSALANKERMAVNQGRSTLRPCSGRAETVHQVPG